MKTIEDIARVAAAELATLFFATFGPALRDSMGQMTKGGAAPAPAASKKANGAPKPARVVKERKERSSPDILKAVVISVAGSLPAWGNDRLAVGDIAKLAETDKLLTSKALRKLFNEGKVAKVGQAKFTRYYIPGTEAPAAASAAELHVLVRLVRGRETKEVSLLWTTKPSASTGASASNERALAFLVEWPLHGRLLFWMDTGLPVAKGGLWSIHPDDLPTVQAFFAAGNTGSAPKVQATMPQPKKRKSQ